MHTIYVGTTVTHLCQNICFTDSWHSILSSCFISGFFLNNPTSSFSNVLSYNEILFPTVLHADSMDAFTIVLVSTEAWEYAGFSKGGFSLVYLIVAF